MQRFHIQAVFGLVAATAIAVPLAAAPSGGEVTTRPARIKGLMIVGGPSHDYDALPQRQADQLKADAGIDVRVTKDLGELTETNLAGYDVVLFNGCLDKGLDEPKQKALIGMLRQGKGLVAMHCALWSFQDWPEWRKMVGGLVLKHDKFGPYEVQVVYKDHPIAAGVPGRFTITDEAYYLDERGSDIQVIARTAETHPGRQGPDPQVWTTRYAGGRVFSIAMGHDQQAQFNPAYVKLLTNGIRWAAGRLGPPVILSELEREEGFIPLFDGKSLKGWRYDPQLWTVRDGIIIGDTHPKPLKVNSNAIADGRFGDFILRFSVKLVSGNSGVQFRSQELPNFEVAGYQADAVPLGWGNLHEQNGRRRLVDGWTGKAETVVNLKDWNDMEVECRGRHIVLRTNGLVTADWTENEPASPMEGIISLQLHRDEPMEVQFTNIRIRPLPPGKSQK
jgi:type 1 glutamine amidotransferase